MKKAKLFKTTLIILALCACAVTSFLYYKKDGTINASAAKTEQVDNVDKKESIDSEEVIKKSFDDYDFSKLNIKQLVDVYSYISVNNSHQLDNNRIILRDNLNYLIMQIYDDLAKKGDADANKALAFMYLRGNNSLKPDSEISDHYYKKAFELYSKAANEGDLKAKCMVAKFYRHGLYVKKDIDKALVLLEEAAVAGEADAYAHIGVIYQDGFEVEKDRE